MGHALIRAALVVAFLAAAWLLGGRYIALAVDLFATGPATSMPARTFEYSPNTLTIGSTMLDMIGPAISPSEVRIDVDAAGKVVLRAGGESFPLGIRTDKPDNTGRPNFTFLSAPGDEVAFDSAPGLMAWPTFGFDFMSGGAPTWKRNIVYRLVWRKRDGATLRLTWRYEQWFESNGGWGSPLMNQEGATGLTGVRIAAPPSGR